jgi:DNA primase
VASACSISGSISSLALLGTNLLPEHIEQLRQFTEVIVCLDKDATRKAIDIAKKLCDHKIAARMVPLPRDLKSMTNEERDDFIRKRIIRGEDNRLRTEQGSVQQGL